jgi:alpha-methylacyl-CoA racemase
VEWGELLEGSDACFAPVLSLREVVRHPHHVARGSFVGIDGIEQPAPAPRFSATPAATPHGPLAGGDGREWATAWGVPEAELEAALGDRARAGMAKAAT